MLTIILTLIKITRYTWPLTLKELKSASDILTLFCMFSLFQFVWWEMFAEECILDFSFSFLQLKRILSENKIPNMRIIIAFLTVVSTIMYKYQEEWERIHKMNFIKACHSQRLTSIPNNNTVGQLGFRSP